TSDHVFMVNNDGEHHFHFSGKVGFPYFGKLILDCIDRTENAMTQEHAFKAAELCVKAQMKAVKVK
ncbi:MAG: gfo/Idh/MocA family oxidoreductase, partial [Oscillospiraceae bacterium]|nr:gfo/Idh/MocA family oxidoreductase [Oscillospiraceae bacterium]